MAFQFENLLVWQKALEITEIVNRIANKFPKEETYVLAAQLKRAADSTALNIAEGSQGLAK
ncbi:MAG: four helix bundle protein [Bacteroidota bacterium]